jgi:hypothetical protein
MLTSGTRRCQCPTCGEYFRSESGFDRHRVGSFETGRRCLTQEEMLERGLVRDERGLWVRGRKSVSQWPLGRARVAKQTISGGEVGKGSGSPQITAQKLDVPKQQGVG